MHLFDIYNYWQPYNGRVVEIDGHKHTLRVSSYRAIYPYEHLAIDVSASACDKRTKYYQREKERAGGDWIISVLDLPPEKQAGILLQLEVSTDRE